MTLHQGFNKILDYDLTQLPWRDMIIASAIGTFTGLMIAGIIIYIIFRK